MGSITSVTAFLSVICPAFKYIVPVLLLFVGCCLYFHIYVPSPCCRHMPSIWRCTAVIVIEPSLPYTHFAVNTVFHVNSALIMLVICVSVL